MIGIKRRQARLWLPVLLAIGYLFLLFPIPGTAEESVPTVGTTEGLIPPPATVEEPVPDSVAGDEVESMEKGGHRRGGGSPSMGSSGKSSISKPSSRSSSFGSSPSTSSSSSSRRTLDSLGSSSFGEENERRRRRTIQSDSFGTSQSGGLNTFRNTTDTNSRTGGSSSSGSGGGAGGPLNGILEQLAQVGVGALQTLLAVGGGMGGVGGGDDGAPGGVDASEDEDSGASGGIGSTVEMYDTDAADDTPQAVSGYRPSGSSGSVSSARTAQPVTEEQFQPVQPSGSSNQQVAFAPVTATTTAAASSGTCSPQEMEQAGRKMARYAIAQALTDYQLREVVDGSDVQRAEQEMVSLLKWKLGGSAAACEQLLQADPGRFRTAFAGDAAALLLEIVSFPQGEVPYVFVPLELIEQVRAGSGQDRGRAGAAITAKMGLPPGAAVDIAAYLGQPAADPAGKTLQLDYPRNFTMDKPLPQAVAVLIRQHKQAE